MAVDPKGFARVKFVYQDSQGQVFPGIQLYCADDTINQDLADAIAEVCYDAWVSNMASVTSTAWDLTETRVIISTGSVDLQGVHTGTDGGSGTDSSLKGSRNDCVVSGYVIADYYRGGKPRTYWPGPGLFATGSRSHWDPDYVSAYHDAVDGLLSDIAGPTSPPPDFSDVIPGCIRRHGPGTSGGPIFDPYGGVRVESRICSQRRRLGPLS